MSAIRAGQSLRWAKTVNRTTITALWYTLFDLSGTVVGTLAGSSTAAGVVPDDTTAGFPAIDSFNGNAGVIAGIELNSTTNSANTLRCSLYDMLFKAGAYSFDAAIVLAAQPSYAARVPGGTDFSGLEIWFECVTAFTGNPTVTITYTDQDGNAGRSTGAIDLALAPTLGRMIQLPLQSGDSGVSKIESVTCTIASVGTFNILVMRPLVKHARAETSNTVTLGPDQTALVGIFDTSALYPIVASGSTVTSSVDMIITLASG